jgi:hypothetical protein
LGGRVMRDDDGGLDAISSFQFKDVIIVCVCVIVIPVQLLLTHMF